MLKQGVGRRIGESGVEFKVLISDGKRMKGYTMKALAGPGDEGELVITIMMPNED